MSFLAWAFGLGLLAVGFPIVFHLIRRAPRGQQVFSSLMFLEASPPRLSRRSRLDEWLLLLLRAAAISLLALAFMRPFVRETALLGTAPLPARRVAVLVDESASMRRGELWAAAQNQVREVLDELEPGDDLALFVFDEQLTTLIDFDAQPTASSLVEKKSQARAVLAERRPGWRATHLGAALVAAADALGALAVQQNSGATLQIALVSDLQRGAKLDTLQNSEFPKDIRVELRSVAPTTPQTNASLRLLTDRNAVETTGDPRVRVTNTSDSPREQFEVRWGGDETGSAGSPPIPVAVPPGSSQVVRLARPAAAAAADHLVLRGDDVDFDNRFYVVPQTPRVARVAYWGDDAADDPQGMQYYLQRALPGTPQRQVEFVAELASATSAGNAARPDLLVAAGRPTVEQLSEVPAFLAAGGTMLLVVGQPDQVAAWRPLIGDVAVASATAARDYLLLAELDFTHPLLQPLASPPYNDFTKIRFWQTTPIESLPAPAVRIASFDDGRPALWAIPQGRGVIYCLAASWAPSASQFALSSKFVTLLNTLLDLARPAPFQSGACLVGEALPLPAQSPVPAAQITTPSGSIRTRVAGATELPRAEEPGIYRINAAGENQVIAANLAAAESELAPLPAAALQELGVTLGRQPPREQQLQELIRLKDLEFEGRQKIWKWLVLGAVLALLAETWWSGRRRPAAAGESAPPSLPRSARSTP